MGWHLAAGDLIRANGAVPMHDTWSLFGSEQVWYNMSWLWDMIISFVHQHAGLEGLFVFTVALPSLLVALLLAILRSRGDIGVNALIFMGMITTYCMLEFATGRPQVAGIFFALAFHHILHKSRQNPAGKALFLLPLITILWVNMHGSFFAGWIVIGAYGLEAIYSKNKSWFLKLFLVGILCVLATLINPYGIHIIDAVLRTLDSVVTKYLREWQPFVFGSIMGPSIWLVVFIIFGDIRCKKLPIADKILALAWLIIMLFSIRNVGLLTIFGAPYIAFNLPPDNLKEANTRKLLAWINNQKIAPAIASLIPLALIAGYAALPLLGAVHYVEKPEKSPMPAINYVMQHYEGKRVLNDYDYGGRIIYEAKGKFPIFMDGRSGTVYNEKILTDYLAFITMEKGWQKVIEPYKPEVILLSNAREFAKDYAKGLYHEDWQQVFRDDVASVYIKKN